MATRKQRRRRAKERRHEWEYVYVDEEGREVPVDEAEPPEKKEPKSGSKERSARGRLGRKVDPPSWRRVLRRAAIFAPFMFIVVYLLKPKGAGVGQVITQAAILIAFFIPFSYFMDSILYRSYRKRMGGDGGTPPAKR